MAAMTVVFSELMHLISGQNGRLLERGVAAFPTTDTTGTLPVKMSVIESAFFFNIATGAPAGDEVILAPSSLLTKPHPVANSVITLTRAQRTITIPIEMSSVAATTGFNIVAPAAGVITAWNFVSTTGLAVDTTNVWDWHVINKGLAAAGTAVVIDRALASGANTTDSDVGGGSAITAFVPKSLGLTATAADKTVVAGDVLNYVMTKGGSATTQAASRSVVTMTATPTSALKFGYMIFGW